MNTAVLPSSVAPSVEELCEKARELYPTVTQDYKAALELRESLLQLLTVALDESYPLSRSESQKMHRANDYARALQAFCKDSPAGLNYNPRSDPSTVEELRHAHVAFMLEVKATGC